MGDVSDPTQSVALPIATIKQLADQVYKTPYTVENEGPLAFPDYNGLGNCSYHEHLADNAADPLAAAKCPHMSIPGKKRPTGIADTVLEFVGNTPMIKLDRLRRALDLPVGIELLAKAECYSAGGSVKDRIAVRMIEEAERSGRIKPGDVLIEPTSGNTGCGLCMAAAVKGYKVYDEDTWFFLFFGKKYVDMCESIRQDDSMPAVFDNQCHF